LFFIEKSEQFQPMAYKKNILLSDVFVIKVLKKQERGTDKIYENLIHAEKIVSLIC
jgi:hypothetical protein